MQLNDEQRKRVLDHIQQKGCAGACPMCRSNLWDLTARIMEMRGYGQGNLFAGGPILPLVVLTCKNCGYTLLFNALRAGIDLTPQKTSPPSQAAPKEATHE